MKWGSGYYSVAELVMKKVFWMLLVIALSLICFGVSVYYLEHDYIVEKPEIVVERMSVTQTVNWYTSLPLNDAESISNAFTIETGIGVKITRDSALVIREKILQEIQSGFSSVDVLTIADIGTYIELQNAGELLYYLSPYYEQYPAEYKDTGYWAVFAGFGICMAYNDKNTDNPPQHWIDLLDKRWQGRIGLEDISTAGSQYGQYYMLRELLGVDFWRQLLSTQKPHIYTETSALADALLNSEIDIAGEFSTNTVYNYRSKKGMPIQGVYPSEGVPFVVNPIAILRQSPHPDESRVLLNFMLSSKGQKIMQSTNFKYSVIESTRPLSGLPPLNTLNVLLPRNASQYTLKRPQNIQEFNDFMGNDQ
jgi:iron(III) transport system substrate-binding protein